MRTTKESAPVSTVEEFKIDLLEAFSCLHLFPLGCRLEKKMNADEFRVHGRETVEYVADYVAGLDKRPVTPDVQPGILRTLLPTSPPAGPHPWNVILDDFDKTIMPLVAHWQSPYFYAYFPSGASFPSLLGGLLGEGIGAIGFSWQSNPAGTELEIVVMNWLGKMIGLPEEFLMKDEKSEGGGVIQSSASECVLLALLAARHQHLELLKTKFPKLCKGERLSKLVAYCSKQTHSCMEKAALIGLVELRKLEVDCKCRLRGDILSRAIEEDKKNGLHPFFCCATLGTTGSCAFDPLGELGPICKENGMWLHVDAAYAGCSFICEDLRTYLKGVKCADSFNANCNKFLLVNYDCSAMWLKDRRKLIESLMVDPHYLKHKYDGLDVDFRHWQIPLSRRFRALKLWCVIRNYGVDGLRAYIRRHINLANYFAFLMNKDKNFQICNDVVLGLVCFQLKNSNELTKKLEERLNSTHKIFLISAELHEKRVLRFCIVSENCTENHIVYAWNLIRSTAHDILCEESLGNDQDDDNVFSSNNEEQRHGPPRPHYTRLLSDPSNEHPSSFTPAPSSGRHVSLTTAIRSVF